MKRSLLFVTITMVFFTLTNAQVKIDESQYEWNWARLSDFVKYNNDIGVRKITSINSNILIGAIAFKQVEEGNLFLPSYVYFSEKPNGQEAGYYVANTSKLTMTMGDKKNKVKASEMPTSKDGWNVFRFGENLALYLRKVQDNAVLENILLYYGIPKKELADRDNTDNNINNAQSSGREVSSKKISPMKFEVVYNDHNNSKKDIFTTPQKEGYTLLNSKTIAGYKCDYYLEGVRTFHFGNGDFVTFSDGTQDGYDDRKPSNSHYAMGDWQLTAENGGVVKKQNGIIKIEFPNGSTIINRKGRDLIWDPSKKKPIVYTNWFNQDQLCLPGEKTPIPYVIFSMPESYDRHYMDFETTGYMKDDRLYAVSNDGSCYAYRQIVNGVPISALATDSIIDVNYDFRGSLSNPDGSQIHLKYANGDYINCEAEGTSYIIKSGSIHRNGGVLSIKEINNKIVKVLTYPNGDKYAGEFKYQNANPMTGTYEGDFNKLSLVNLSLPELQYTTGTLIKSNGKRIQYEDGKSEQQIVEERRAAQAKATNEYKNLCQKYGEKYVNAALEQNPIVGMPEELLTAAFNLRLIESSTNYKLYRITGLKMLAHSRNLIDEVLLYSIYVSNGRVTWVRHWQN